MAAAAAPHVVMLPFPSQGHIKPMFFLAELLSQAGFDITFVNTDHSHRRMLNAVIDLQTRIRFATIPDGLGPEHPRSGPSRTDVHYSVNSTIFKALFKDLVASFDGLLPTCIISDGIMSFAIDVAEELGIPAFTFRTYTATNTWIYFHLQNLILHGEIPVYEGKENMDGLISYNIPGLENMMRRRDLPQICRLQPEHKRLQFFITQTSKMTKASALILNTFEQLESPIISHLHSIFPTVYAIGPLHAFTKSNNTTLVINSNPYMISSGASLIKTDRSCLKWLDSQQPKSVLYVSFGSVITLSRDEFLEFLYGLVNSGKRFLWAMRPDLISDDDNGPSEIPEDLKNGAEKLGRVVGWVPQDEVLAHFAIGGFLTHSGWNSTLESLYSGVPMICWPKSADQQVNSRCVSEMWKVGLDMKDTCDRSTVEKMVRDLMGGSKREEIMKSTDRIARLAQDSISDGGSSNRNFKKLIEDIKLLHSSRSGFNGCN